MAPPAAQVSRKGASNLASDLRDDDAAVQTAHHKAPLTAQRRVPADLSEKIPDAGVPRAVNCPSIEQPHGTPEYAKAAYGTPLQQHIAFFDRNEDGIITPLETYDGLRRIGFNILLSIFGVFIIHFGLAYMSQLMSAFRADDCLQCKHGSDTAVYDTEGRFIPQKMEEIFSKYDKENKGHLTLKDLLVVTESNRNALDIFGWIASKFEWGALVNLPRAQPNYPPPAAFRSLFSAAQLTHRRILCSQVASLPAWRQNQSRRCSQLLRRISVLP
ncbi:MAG: Caleosin related protein-domain-containing protein [Olpidium bornovanus]|uniref:Caleosin related protein-domain-containing protein n=1 Tax=Olpidium bornovanus TaxID=278681 RepID=A0A8H7ZTI3_9FUNG|nr:MAG: Caleosin related protein-domain-containing protein [Olpidium bornovanus]